MRDLTRLSHWRRPHLVIALAALGLGLTCLPLVIRQAPLLIYNASASAPVGFYLVWPAEAVARGDLLLVRTPDSVRNLAADRGYLPLSAPLVKRAAAIAGDHVCTSFHTVRVKGAEPVRQLLADRQGRPLPQWIGCRRLGGDEIFLLMQDVPDSFDSRYFGPVPRSAVIGRLIPLWLSHPG